MFFNRRYKDTLAEAGLVVVDSFGVRGGRAADGLLVSTTWTDIVLPNGRRPIWDGKRGVNDYALLWRDGAFRQGGLVRLLLLKCAPDAVESAVHLDVRRIVGSMILPTLWRIVTVHAEPQPVTLHRAELLPTEIPSQFRRAR